MKRFAMGIVWFVVFWLMALLEVGIVIAVELRVAGAARNDQVVRSATDAIVARYGLAIFLVALLASVIGTVTGFLPGTRRKILAPDS